MRWCYTAVRRAILLDEMRRAVRGQPLGYVATVCPDGTPSVSPKVTLGVSDGNHLAFLAIRSPRTVANRRERSAVEVNVVDPFAQAVLIQWNGTRRGCRRRTTEADLRERCLTYRRLKGEPA